MYLRGNKVGKVRQFLCETYVLSSMWLGLGGEESVETVRSGRFLQSMRGWPMQPHRGQYMCTCSYSKRCQKRETSTPSRITSVPGTSGRPVSTFDGNASVAAFRHHGCGFIHPNKMVHNKQNHLKRRSIPTRKWEIMKSRP